MDLFKKCNKLIIDEWQHTLTNPIISYIPKMVRWKSTKLRNLRVLINSLSGGMKQIERKIARMSIIFQGGHRYCSSIDQHKSQNCERKNKGNVLGYGYVFQPTHKSYRNIYWIIICVKSNNFELKFENLMESNVELLSNDWL